MEASRLSADKKVELLSEEEFHHVLKELIDHNLPDREKCPLVQHLKAEDAKSKDNSPSESPHQTHHSTRAGNRLSAKARTRVHALSKDSEFQSSHQQQYQANCHTKQVNYVQALQELPATSSSSCCSSNHCDDSQQRAQSGLLISAGGSSSTSGSRKPNRANSFTMPSSASDNNRPDPNSSSGNKILGQHHQSQQQWSVPLTNGVLSSEPSGEDVTASSAVVGAAADELSLSESCQSAPSLATLSSPSLAYTSATSAHTTNDSHSAPPALDNSSQLNGDSYGDHIKSDNFSSVHLTNIHSLVNSIGGDGEPTYQRVLVKKPISPTLSVEEEDDKMFVEMKNFQRKANIVEYRSDINKLDIRTRNDHSVDRAIEMPLLTASRPKEPQPYDPILGHVSHPNLFAANCNTHSINNNVINNSTNTIANSANTTNNNTSRMKKKKRKEEKITTMSHEIDGYIGYIKDIEILESLITGKSSNGNADANNNNKKNKNKVDKEGGKRKNQDKEKRGNNGGEADKVTGEEDKSAHRNHNGKVPIGLVGSNSSSLSGDDISTAMNKSANGVLSNATSPDLSSLNGTKSKKRKGKEKVQKAASTGGETDNAAKVGSTLKGDKSGGEEQTNTLASTRGKSSSTTTNHHHSSLDDFEDASDAEDEDEEDSAVLFLRSKKSNSLQSSSNKVSKDLALSDSLNDATEELCTVSDSEMADREKDFVTPRNKYFKKKKVQVPRNQYGPIGGSTSRTGEGHHQAQHSQSQHHHQSHYGKDAYTNKGSSQMSQNLGRGYESERECSTITNSAIGSNTFACQSLSSSMLVIDDSKRQTRPPRQQSHSHDSSSLVDTLSNSDNDLMFTLGPMPVPLQPDNGPKMPSYADIAKSLNLTGKAHSAPSTRLSQVSESDPPDEFPQLNTSGSSDQSVNSVCEVTKSATTPKARDHVAQPGTMATTSAANGSSSATSPTATTTTANLPPPQQPNDNQNDSNTAEDEIDNIAESFALEHIPEADSVAEESEQVQPDMVDLDAQDSVCVDNKKSPSDTLSPSGRQSPPVVIFGNNSTADLVFGDDSPITNSNNDQTNPSIKFGFFEDDDYPPGDYLLDKTNDTSNDSEENFTNVEQEQTSYKFNLQKINDLKICSNNNLENFYKNAVHVNDLEDRFRKIDSETQDEKLLSEDKSSCIAIALSNNSSSNFISSSPNYPGTTCTSQEQVSPKKPFVSCLAKYRTIRLKETVEPCIQNYPVILALVSGQWNKCKDLPTI